ncbi:histone-lysine N-methyltransferase 2B-like [Elysia marginata]|uniref:Histone-lysine N-methyltransferase 2B-like n=1 Tax=Elysia marginata TaxID=1093978 RepID=A0AAV4FNG5_9GAST|nr:histone-lysine N-methyltransferase 2B-like [Elysia marginata]
MVAALHRIYLNPNGNIYPVMKDVIGPNAQDLSLLLYRPGPPAESVRGGRGGGGRGGGGRDENAELFQILQYVIENIIYHMTEIMPKSGVLGTHKKAAVFELIKSNKRFPDGYFWQIELDRLEFDGSGRTKNVGNLEAFILLVGVFLSRSMITTLLMRPVDYGMSNEALSEVADRNLKVLATALLFIVRRVSVKRESPMLVSNRISV